MAPVSPEPVLLWVTRDGWSVTCGASPLLYWPGPQAIVDSSGAGSGLTEGEGFTEAREDPGVSTCLSRIGSLPAPAPCI